MRIVIDFQIKDEISDWVFWSMHSGRLQDFGVIGLFISIELMVQGVNAIVLSRVIKEGQKEIKTELK